MEREEGYVCDSKLLYSLTAFPFLALALNPYPRFI